MPLNPVHSIPLSSSKPTVVSQIGARIGALDWTKGALVVFMVIYHAINYSQHRPLAFRYLSFLPSSFILITGFLVSQIYASRYDLSTWKPYLRLFVRGFKLFILFTILNIANCILKERDVLEGMWQFSDRAQALFLSGNGRAAIFEVLLPIAYFLMLAPGLLWLRSKSVFLIPLFAAAIFMACLVLERTGNSRDNLTLLSAGFVGLAVGLVPLERLNKFAGKIFPVILIYAGSRGISYFFGESYALQTLGAITALLFIYSCALQINSRFWLSRQITLLGHYSLLAYLAQIAMLQIIVGLLRGLPGKWTTIIAMMLLTTAFLMTSARIIHELRKKSHALNVAYKGIFA